MISLRNDVQFVILWYNMEDCDRRDGMDTEDVLNKVKEYVKNISYRRIRNNWWYVNRIYESSLKIMKEENLEVNRFVVAMIALFHHIFYIIENSTKDVKGEIMEILEKLKVVSFIRKDSLDNIIRSAEILNKKQYSESNMSMEFNIVKDALLIDELGALGFAKIFMRGSLEGRQIYNPKNAIIAMNQKDNMMRETLDSINYFYLKVMHQTGELTTNVAKQAAVRRMRILESFLEEFFLEWNMEDIKEFKGELNFDI